MDISSCGHKARWTDGLKQLVSSPSGFFALLSLILISYVTLKQPAVGGVAFAAFFPVVVSILTWTEHKETMAGISKTSDICDSERAKQ